MEIMYLEDISESWKAETSEKIKGMQSQDTSKRASYTHGTERAGVRQGCSQWSR